MSSTIEIILPADQLEGATAKISEWLITLGTAVKAGDPIVELETDKVTMEVCAPESGLLDSILKSVGEEVNADSVLGTISQASVNTPSKSIEVYEHPVVDLDAAANTLIDTTADVAIDVVLSADLLEGTTAKVAGWLIEIGDTIKQGEALLELDTDKVTLEVCAPTSGQLTAIHKQVGEEVEPQSLLGKLTTATATVAPVSTASSDVTRQSSLESIDSATIDTQDDSNRDNKHLLGPAVRKLLRGKGLDIQLIAGSGRGGRITKDDVLSYINNPITKPTAKATSSVAVSNKATSNTPLCSHKIPHTPMRKAIANHVVKSLLHTSPHVTSVFEMDMSNIIEHRRWHKKEFIEKGAKLTFTAYFLAASVAGMKAVPQMNARFHEDALELFDNVNIGVGTALGDDGLVVPVVQQVQEKCLFDIALALQAQTEKARTGNLKPADMKNGTFTISNHGVSGSLFAAPIIINQPQVAILGIGKLEKRVIVEEIEGKDIMTIKPMCYVSLSIDHRAVDAFQTNKFLSEFVYSIENWGN